MKALTLVAPGGIEQLKVQELPEPAIESPNDVLVRVQAAALNRLDLFVAAGLPGASLTFPHVVGSDGAGVVHRVGPAVREFRPGDRVMINPTLSCGECSACVAGEDSLCATLRVIGEHCAGTVAEFIVVPSRNLAAVPADMSWPEAAAFSLATLTAWRMLVTLAQLRAEETVLIWGIGGPPHCQAGWGANDRHQRFGPEARNCAIPWSGHHVESSPDRHPGRGPTAYRRARRRRDSR
jgi:NADPH:quinone reductase-like Zn-dependent oxidoreductase